MSANKTLTSKSHLFHTIPVICTEDGERHEYRAAKIFYRTFAEALKGTERELNEFWKVDYELLNEQVEEVQA